VTPEPAVKTTGALAVPEYVTVTASVYVPARTCTVVPATALAFAALIEQNGRADVPGPEFEHATLPLSTYSVVAASAVVAGSTAAPDATTPMTRYRAAFTDSPLSPTCIPLSARGSVDPLPGKRGEAVYRPMPNINAR
jgi:hypothetical protein